MSETVLTFFSYRCFCLSLRPRRLPGRALLSVPEPVRV